MSRHHESIKNDPRYKAWQKEVVSVGACEWCGATEDLTADHIVPLAEGGDPWSLDNGRCLCRPCNSRKGARREAPEVRVTWVNDAYPELDWITSPSRS